MVTTIKLADAYSVTIPKPKGYTGPSVAGLDIDPARLPEHIGTKLWFYGLQQKLADSVASNEKYPSPKDKRAGMAETLEALYAGDWGRERTSDPVRSAARQIATAKIQGMESFKAWATKAGKKAGDKEYAEKIAANLETVMALPDVQAEAKRRVEAVSGLEVEVELKL